MSKKKLIITLLFPVIRLWAATWRFRGSLPSDIACIMLMWHEELFPVLKAGSHQNWMGIISASKDGDYLERLITRWGYRTIRGSASKHDKATSMLRDTIKLAKNNKLTIAVDGPRGPRRQVKIGMLLAAKKSEVPIYLARIKARGFRLEKAWDNSLIPYPFATIDVVISGPNIVDKSCDKDELKALSIELKNKLDALGNDNV